MGLPYETLAVDFALLLTALLTFLVWKVYSIVRFFERNGIKMAPLWDILVFNFNLILVKISFIDSINDFYNTLKEERVIGYIQFFRPIVMIRDPELAERVLIKDFTSFHDHGIEPDLKTNPLDGHLFNMSGGEWKALRNRLSPVFTSGRLRNMLTLVAEKADKLVDVVPRGEDVLIRDYLSRFAMDVIGSTAFGIESGALDNPDCHFKKMANKIFRPGRLAAMKGIVRFLLPKVAKFFKFKVFDQEIEDFFFSITKQAFDHRTKTGERRGDFVDLLLQLRGRGKLDIEGATDNVDATSAKESITELILTDELLTAQSFIFLVAGWETSATAMMYSVYYLAKHEDIQEKLRSHLKENPVTDYDTLKKAKYLNACVSEGLRLFAPAGGLFRVCTKEFLVPNSEQKIEKGTMVIIPTHGIHRDSKYFPDPFEYRPERFLEDEHILPGTFTPFGEGPRICIAERFAKMEIRIAIAKLVENFRMKLSPKTKEPLKLSTDTFTNDVQGGVWITLEEV